MRGLHGLSIGFAAGAVGGLICSLVIWLSGELGLTTHYGVRIHPVLEPAWLYPRVVWGGIWGMTFILPYLDRFVVVKGLVFSLFPTAFQLFVVFPVFLNQGIMGTRLGEMTPFFVVGFNAVWGLVAGYWLRIAR